MTHDFKCLIKWLEIREANGIKLPISITQLAADIDHSALLIRLLEGKKPLEKAPPKTFSYPNYQMIENGKYNPLEVWKMENQSK